MGQGRPPFATTLYLLSACAPSAEGLDLSGVRLTRDEHHLGCCKQLREATGMRSTVTTV